MDTAAVSAFTEMLAQATDHPGGLHDAARVDLIRALERLTCVAAAAQARASVDLDHSQRAEQAAAGVPPARQGRGVAEQVALARRESPHRGRRHLGLAKVAIRELPHTWEAWRTGRITEFKVVLIARETACLSLADRLAVDRLVAADAARLEGLGEQQLAAEARSHAERLDPEAALNRRRRAEADRHVSLRPAPDTMTRLSALLPVKEGVAVLAALTRAADSARSAGDPRTKGQLMADHLVGTVLRGTPRPGAITWADADSSRGQGCADGPARGRGCTGGRDDTGGRAEEGAARTPAVPISLNLVMTDQALFGRSDSPAHLRGYGPIPAELARELVSDACASEEKVWLRRLYTDPGTGELAQLDARGRLFPGNLARFISLRDQICRTPWCDAPVRHHDHALEHARGGATDSDNGQGLCEACNHAKQAPGWHARPTSDASGRHTITTRTPTGHTYRSRAPALVTIHEREVPVITVDLYLAS